MTFKYISRSTEYCNTVIYWHTVIHYYMVVAEIKSTCYLNKLNKTWLIQYRHNDSLMTYLC